MSEHTKEPWKVSGTENIVAGGQYVVALDCKPQDARRIVACVNACAGAPTDELEKRGFLAMRTKQVAELEKQRDGLLAAMVEIKRFGKGDPIIYAQRIADTAIDNAEPKP